MENLYDILEINKNATQKEIKEAYVKLLRKYPPEQNKEKFQKIREAYEILSNEKSRNEYDVFLEYGDEIIEIEKIADKYLDQGKFKKAIMQYKKILVINPDLNFAKNKLGLALAYDNQLDKALEQFLELIGSDEENPVYNSNIAYVYLKKEEYLKAEKYFLRAHELDPINDNIINNLVDIYITQKKYKKAIILLESCIGKYKDDNFRDFTYYLEMITVYIFENNKDMIESVIEKIIDIVPNDDNIKDYVSKELGKVAYKLYEAKLYEFSQLIASKAKEIGNEELIEPIYMAAEKEININREYKLMMDDVYITNGLKRLISLWVADNITELERKKYFNDIMNQIGNEDLDKLYIALNRLKSSYKALYKLNSNAIDKLQESIIKLKPNVNRRNNNNSNNKSNVSNSSNDATKNSHKDTNINQGMQNNPQDREKNTDNNKSNVSNSSNDATKNSPKDDESNFLKKSIILLFAIIIILSIVLFNVKNKLDKSRADNISNNYNGYTNNEFEESTLGDCGEEYDDYSSIEPELGAIEKDKEDIKKNYNYIDELLPQKSSIYYNVYTNAYTYEDSALDEVNKLKVKGINAIAVYEDNYYKVNIGNSETLQGAISIKDKLSNLVNGEIYILAHDSDVENILNNAESHINYNNLDLAKEELNNIKNIITKPGYEGYKKEYDNLENKIKENKIQREIKEDENSIYTLLNNIFYYYDIAVQNGNPEVVSPYLVYNGDLYKSYKENIPKYYQKNIVVQMIDYTIENIKIENDNTYRVTCLSSYRITNQDESREQLERADYIIKKDYVNGNLLVDRLENWKIVE
ncbi:MAG: DnaJ domain-containing protein [Bacilli bacterium]|nr:DnaJ domain-containing protein [Bacilli bacterium]